MAAPSAMAGDVRSHNAVKKKRQKERLPKIKIHKRESDGIQNHVEKPAPNVEPSDSVKFTQMLVKPNKKWYEQLESRSRASEMRWVRTVLARGVLADKVAAHTLLIQESPVHNLASLDALTNMVTPKGKKECLLAMDALRDLFLSDLLTPDKKLRPFCQRVETASFDQVEKLKLRAVTCMFHLLTYHPEREQLLLERLVNKLGDRTHAVASRVAHHLTQLTNHHPLMKPTMLSEVERFVYRPNVAPKAQYYALCFLSQVGHRWCGWA
ncbi:hypothetical protein HPB48_001523 [Haemaphysalis longicornis]|uniref:Uncharacterized protein n=1 Tax=Haemaphysalis longicornis TaxID=44386 RepID=A0A9J6H1V5_HAELO|nr:hypothetical protein HPB48_001523 [Haemaphysalis longicornis]